MCNSLDYMGLNSGSIWWGVYGCNDLANGEAFNYGMVPTVFAGNDFNQDSDLPRWNNNVLPANDSRIPD